MIFVVFFFFYVVVWEVGCAFVDGQLATGAIEQEQRETASFIRLRPLAFPSGGSLGWAGLERRSGAGWSSL